MDSIHFIENNKLIEYNLITKQKHIIYCSNDPIVQYNVDSKNIIIRTLICRCNDKSSKCLCGGKVFWNGTLVYNLMVVDFKFMKTCDGEYIIIDSCCFCNLQIKIEPKYQFPYFCVSTDGTRIILLHDHKLYERNISNTTIDEIFNIYGAKCVRGEDQYMFLEWITHSNFILINKEIIFNVDTCREMLIHPDPYQIIFVNSVSQILARYNKCVALYDTNSMESNTTTIVRSNQIFLEYNQKLDILVSNQLEQYQVKISNNKPKLALMTQTNETTLLNTKISVPNNNNVLKITIVVLIILIVVLIFILWYVWSKI